MNINEQLKQLGIESVLIVDDETKNLDAAKKYFSSIDQTRFEYASSESEAVKKIKEAFDQKKRYTFVLTDLEMEKNNSGITVATTALQHGSLYYIVTGRNYHKNEGDHHGPSTTITPSEDIDGGNIFVNSKKDKDYTWEKLFQIAVESTQLPLQRGLRNALNRRYRFDTLPMGKDEYELMEGVVRINTGE